MLTTKREALWYLGKYPSRLYIIDVCLREYFVSYMTPKCSPYVPRIHNLLDKMNEEGLVTKWDQDTTYYLQLKALREGTAKLHDTRIMKVLKLVEFQTSSRLLGILVSFSIGFLAFISEEVQSQSLNKNYL
jgi:hypothetical protein